jgi:hypothetical protein
MMKKNDATKTARRSKKIAMPDLDRNASFPE